MDDFMVFLGLVENLVGSPNLTKNSWLKSERPTGRSWWSDKFHIAMADGCRIGELLAAEKTADAA
jgi:hypothetical protein